MNSLLFHMNSNINVCIWIVYLYLQVSVENLFCLPVESPRECFFAAVPKECPSRPTFSRDICIPPSITLLKSIYLIRWISHVTSHQVASLDFTAGKLHSCMLPMLRQRCDRRSAINFYSTQTSLTLDLLFPFHEIQCFFQFPEFYLASYIFTRLISLLCLMFSNLLKLFLDV